MPFTAAPTMAATPTLPLVTKMLEDADCLCFTRTLSAVWDSKKRRMAKQKLGPPQRLGVLSELRGYDAKLVNTGETMLGVYNGAQHSRLFVLDIDVDGLAESTPQHEVTERAEDVAGPELWGMLTAANTVQVRTGSGGAHFYFWLREGVDYTRATSRSLLGSKPKVDILGAGGFTWFAGSSYGGGAFAYTHVSGAVVQPVPAWLHAELVRLGCSPTEKAAALAGTKRPRETKAATVSPATPAAAAAAAAEPEPLAMPLPAAAEGEEEADARRAFRLVRECLNPARRAGTYTDWVSLGHCLQHVAPAALQDEARAAWAELSRRAPGYEDTADAVFEEKWAALAPAAGGAALGFGSLVHWAKEDSPAQWEAIQTERRVAVKMEQTPALVVDGDDESYAGVKKRIEATWFMLTHSAEYCNETPRGLKRHSRADTTTILENVYYEELVFNGKTKKDELKRKPFTAMWFKDANIRAYARIDFLPPGAERPPAEERVYNMFQGFAAAKLPKAAAGTPTPAGMELILTHVLHMCGDVPEHRDYILNLFAHLFQLPGVKRPVMPIFKGYGGTGKDLLIGFLGALLGPELYFSTERAETDVLGKFNALCTCKLLINMEELNLSQTGGGNAEALKGRICKSTMSLECKGRDALTVGNYALHTATTNRDVAVVIEENGERRFVILESPSKMKDTATVEYLTALVAAMEDPAVQRAFFDLLMARDISTFNPYDHRARPQTAALEEAAAAVVSPVARFLEWLVSGRSRQRGVPMFVADSEDPAAAAAVVKAAAEGVPRADIGCVGKHAVILGDAIARPNMLAFTPTELYKEYLVFCDEYHIVKRGEEWKMKRFGDALTKMAGGKEGKVEGDDYAVEKAKDKKCDLIYRVDPDRVRKFLQAEQRKWWTGEYGTSVAV